MCSEVGRGARAGKPRCFLCAETALSRVEAANLQTVFALNAFGPILVSKVGRHIASYA